MNIDLNQVWTVKEFAEEFGYNEEYVRQCCRGQSDFRTGTPLTLPNGWKARKIGRDWFLEPKSSKELKGKKR
jgi:hypothetical protein